MEEDRIIAATTHINKQLKTEPSVGVICIGVAHDEVSDNLKQSITLNLVDIQGFPYIKTMAHRGTLHAGYVGPKYTLVMQNKVRPNEGFPLRECMLPVRIMQRLGVKTIILAGVACLLNEKYKLGDLMVVADQIYLPGLANSSALISECKGYKVQREDRILQDLYPEALINKFKEAVTKCAPELTVHQGTHVMFEGPAFCTDAELKFLQSIGADSVGMSIGHEAVVANEGKMDVLAVVVLADRFGEYMQKHASRDIRESISSSTSDMMHSIKVFIENL